MKTCTAHSATTRPRTQPLSWISESGLRWALGATIWLVAMVLVVVAIIYAPDSTRANTRLCLEQVANEEHTSLEAFFQNPAQQDALAQAVTICSR
ncbi:hypothetical protein [Paraburkholderia sp. BL21I4N1]|uniref:hypothetical protein n=1 Tax=Paraburkholderia sp. BL21I4N1 TaxID=1938801 RepID=UPI000CFB2C1D|nr:hypothetical protein [Paraburkholderia sp. BL21I4N1]PQV54428.1 hypothetical protein B0G83_101610 [Paraburkholderia sp. BL21I4N1]